ncbi:PEP/pyruvate-binding domain-containing protein [Streptomyces sp. HD]|uniref:PEP/pyruvate-binding domain-containing protein n=1 Tax=Streptomyces sp. HD TaxID=3020892 RepID=UPI00232D70B6|nr:PEP/pyruvate-binding domain-containing protein [Streptomyces sp. HD]MDC0769427.1 PEP/pyruvate-binding domain-containing protein [Streptomyces sp. HD]
MTTLDERHGEGARDGEEHRGGVALGEVVEECGPAVVPLDLPDDSLPRLIGSKAANLARAARAGLPVLPGFVIPHRASGDMVALRRAWDELSAGGTRPLVVRSSSPQEDTEDSSLAGQFASVLDVRGWRAFRTAVQTVLDSAHRPDGSAAPMAVLVQPMITARVGGVMFGADPVEGRVDRMLVSAVRGGPDSLVSGARAGTDYWLSGRGRLLRTEAPGDPRTEAPGDPASASSAKPRPTPSEKPWPTSSEKPWPTSPEKPWQPESSQGPRRRPSKDSQADPAPLANAPSANPRATPTGHGSPLTRAELFRLARLARQVRRVFGGPQDVEFGFDADGRLWLFQSRPITAMAARPARGARLLGPGPVAETLPGQLAPLEEDLWVAPMARGLAAALDIGGTAPRRLLKSVPVVTTVAGRAAADLRLLGTVPPRHRWLALLNPAPGARRLTAAWRVGRLASSLPGLATDLTADVDRRLAEIPPPSGLSGSSLAAELRWTRRVLVSLHSQEALAGALLSEPPKARTAAGTALAALAEARAQGIPDDQVIATDPVVLALTAPSLRRRGELPNAPAAPNRTAPDQADGVQVDAIQAAGLQADAVHTAGLQADAVHTAGLQADAVHTAGLQADGLRKANDSLPPAPRPPALEPARQGTPTSAAFSVHATQLTGTTQATSSTKTTSQAPPAPSAPSAPPAPPALSTLSAPPTPPTPPTLSAPPALQTLQPLPAPPITSTPNATALAQTTSRPPATSPRPALLTPLPPREALRLRIRWVQELQVRLVRDVARRLGIDVERVGLLRWAELAAVLNGGALPGDLHARVPQPESPPLPDAFRLADGQVVVAERAARRGDGVRGVSAGRVVGTVWDGTGPRPTDAVLVVRTLDPALAPLLPGLTGLVAQTGSPLSHLAVLAREFGLPAVVGATDAVRRFPPGSRLTVDGTAGDVRLGDAP